MTQNEIASAIGITANNLSSYLTGKRTLGPKVAKKVAKHLGQSANWRFFVEMPGDELRDALFSPLRISEAGRGVNQ